MTSACKWTTRASKKYLGVVAPDSCTLEADMRNRANVMNSNSPDRVDPSQLRNIPKGENLLPAPIDGSVDKWFFISGAAV